jgi:hypothetical protein
MPFGEKPIRGLRGAAAIAPTVWTFIAAGKGIGYCAQQVHPADPTRQ